MGASRRARLVAVVSALATSPTAVLAQGAALTPNEPITGSRLGNVATLVQSFGDLPQVVPAYSAEDATASRFTGYVAKCTASRKPALVDQYLHTGGEQARAIWAQVQPTYVDCFHNYAFAMRYWGGISLQVPALLLRGKLAEARIGKPPVAKLQPVSAIAVRPTWQPGEHADHLLLMTGACIGAAQPGQAAALLRTAPGSKAEIAETDAMLPAAGRACVPTGETLRASMSNLRAAIALGLYHRLDGSAVATEKN